MKIRIFTLIMSLFVATMAFAYDACIDGIYYDLDTENKTAMVTHDGNEWDENNAGYKLDVVIPEKVTYNGIGYNVTSISSHAFFDCSLLNSIEIPNSVTSIGSEAFVRCYNLASIAIPNSVTFIEYRAFYDCEGLTSVILGTSMTRVEDEVFYRCSKLTSVTCLGSIPAELGESVFFQTSLAAVYIPDNTFSAYKDVWGNDYNFVNNETTLSIYVETSGTLADKIFDAGLRPNVVSKLIVTGTLDSEDFACMRETMTSLVEVDLSGITNTTGVDFSGKRNLHKIILPINLTYIGDAAFSNCVGLTSIEIPNSVTEIGSEAFFRCYNLASITIPNSVTSIEYKAFDECSSLDSVIIPNGVTSIGSEVFSGCTSLTFVTIPNSVRYIGNAFSGCSGLVSIIIPSGVTAIYQYAFSGCENLSSISCLGTIPPSAYNLGIDTKNCTLIVPKIAYNDYLRHAYWGQFLNIETIDVDYRLLTAVANNIEYGIIEGCGYYNNGEEAILNAIPNEGYYFVKWSDEKTDNPRTVIVTQDSVFTAIFEPNRFTITTSVNDEVMGSVTESGEYAYGTEVTLIATANLGYRFAQWTDGNTDNPRTIIVTEAKEYAAEFEVEVFGVYAAAENPSMGGVEITLTAKPIEGFEFVEWTDGNTDNPRILILSEDIEVYARFRVKEDTDVENAQIVSANVYSREGILYIEGAEADYHVLDAAGRLIYTGRDAQLSLPRGVYVIAIGGEVEKVVL